MAIIDMLESTPPLMEYMAERADFVSTHARNLDVAFNLTENHFRGETTIELSVADVRQAR